MGDSEQNFHGGLDTHTGSHPHSEGRHQRRRSSVSGDRRGRRGSTTFGAEKAGYQHIPSRDERLQDLEMGVLFNR